MSLTNAKKPFEPITQDQIESLASEMFACFGGEYSQARCVEVSALRARVQNAIKMEKISSETVFLINHPAKKYLNFSIKRQKIGWNVKVLLDFDAMRLHIYLANGFSDEEREQFAMLKEIFSRHMTVLSMDDRDAEFS